MIGMSDMLHRAPMLLYVAALVMFFASIALTSYEMSLTSAYSVPGDPLVTVAKLRIFFTAALDAIYIASNGAIVHLLLAIWRKMPDRALKREAAE